MPAPRPDRAPLGATVLPGGGVRFAVWAPRVRRLGLRLTAGPGAPRDVPMRRDGDVHEVVVEEAGAGTEYLFVLDGDRARPDPRSRRQRHGVHGPSTVVEASSFRWTDDAWRGLPLESYVLYEAHVGTFTPEGTFDAAITRLPHLGDVGVTAVELMPVASFPGRRNWGYDGVHLWAPQESYGGPEGLRRLVDAAHERGLAVVLDVVYNHLGPEGNYLGEFGPYFTDRQKTPWGGAMNLDGPDSAEVRRFFVENAAHWAAEYHIDGLRLDAIHSIFDSSEVHILQEIGEAFRAASAARGRIGTIVAESAFNDARIVRPVTPGGRTDTAGLDGQWMDDFHHAVRTALTREARGYMSRFGRLDQVAAAIDRGFVGEGRDYRRHAPLPPETVAAASSADVPGGRFVIFVQNHDQVANASGGRRLVEVAGVEAAKVAAALVACAPCVPLLFQGEEYGETNPFPFFTDFQDERLKEPVRTGRIREMKGLGFDEPPRDPFADETFEAARLEWRRLEEPRHRAILDFYRDLYRLRRETPALARLRKDLTRTVADEAARTLVVLRGADGAPPALLVANLAAAPRRITLPPGRWRLALRTDDPVYAGPADRPVPPREAAGGTAVELGGPGAAVYLGG